MLVRQGFQSCVTHAGDRLYRCATQAMPEYSSCDAFRVDEDSLERALVERVLSLVDDPELLARVREGVREVLFGGEVDVTQELRELERQRIRKFRARDKIDREYLDAETMTTEHYRRACARYNAEITQIERRLGELNELNRLRRGQSREKPERRRRELCERKHSFIELVMQIRSSSKGWNSACVNCGRRGRLWTLPSSGRACVAWASGCKWNMTTSSASSLVSR